MHHIVAFCLAFSGACLAASLNDCSTGRPNNGWVPYVAGVDPTLLDTYVTYWRYTVPIPQNGIHIRVTGRFPFGRYASFNVYDQVVKDRGDSLSDIEMKPNSGSVNPYLPGNDFHAENRDYTLNVVPQNLKEKFVNALALPERDGEKGKAIELWYRIYVPIKGHDGGVPIPSIEVFDPVSGKPVACPILSEIPYENDKARENLVPPSSGDGNDAMFFPASGNAMYPNGHTSYLALRWHVGKPLFFGTDEKIMTFRFRTPTFPNSSDAQFTGFTGGEQVRYYSFCLSGVSTITTDCLADYEIKCGTDGIATVVVGPEELRDEVKAKGLNFLGRGKLAIAFIAYRNLMTNPNFKGRFDDPMAVPPWTAADNEVESAVEARQARSYIGDYAPQGKLCTWSQYLENACAENP
ncbi:MAG: hypothetical protein HYR96_05020 [Deltaproteobacteria bacterium]|nr:hypothetical protein [Deltaproteobacteria bacterium]MBI3294551.1 hypothetical protein [Deltaproteobacteria bacterium]